MGRIMDVAAALFCIGAGVYLLSEHSVSVPGITGGTSWFEIIAHGMGAYFIGKGLFIARSTQLDSEVAKATRKLLELASMSHERETWSQRPIATGQDYSGLPEK